jgi:nicotinate-nucleotide adenylyltransferase
MDSSTTPVRRIGVMGGTFDPIHLGHLIAASEALHAFELDRVIFVPTGQPWQKSNYSDAEDRFMMTSLAAAMHPCFAVSRMELDRKGATYTADTMRELRRFHGSDVTLFFIAGADAVAKVATWKKVEELAEEAEMIAVTRPGFELDDLPSDPSWPKTHVMEMPGIDISATDIRARVRMGRPIDFLVPPAVARYIRDHGLYVGSDER